MTTSALFGLQVTNGIIGNFTINDNGRHEPDPITIYQQKAGEAHPVKTTRAREDPDDVGSERIDGAGRGDLARRRHQPQL